VPIIVHHAPSDSTKVYKLYAWLGSTNWTVAGTSANGGIDFTLPDVDEVRQLQFKYFLTDSTGAVTWESDNFNRLIWQANPSELWSFDFSGRLIYSPPFPTGVSFAGGDVVTMNLVTQSRFNGGSLYVWDPYNPSNSAIYFPQTGRADPVSTFAIALAPWMVKGFHFKFVDPKNNFELDTANRVWRPGDGKTLWMKSGQVSIRNTPLMLTAAPVQLLYPSAMGSPPNLVLNDPVEDVDTSTPSSSIAPAASPAFLIATYAPTFYPQAMYYVSAASGESGDPLLRPFPVDPFNLKTPTCIVLGVGGSLSTTPSVAAGVPLSILPLANSSFTGGLSIQVGLGACTTLQQTVAANQQPDGTWSASITVVETVPNWVRLVPTTGVEPTPYPPPYNTWIDTRKVFTPTTTPPTYYTTEGVYGAATGGKTPFADPLNRTALMQSAFGAAAGGGVTASIFSGAEMPHGVTITGSDVYFVVHAPHAVLASLVLVNENGSGPATRLVSPMSLTTDTLYWWCKQPLATAGPGTRYHFILNDNQEVMDPAAKEVLDRGNYETNFGDDPNDVNTSWSVVVDVASLRGVARASAWQTMGWEALLKYEIHPSRFTDSQPGTLTPLDLIADELQVTSRLGQPGYLHDLPITTLSIMPVHEFKSSASWGYNPAFFFAIDGSYGGCAALARLVNAAHVAGRGVVVDVVYNHMNDSPLTQIAYDVYRNGDAWGDKINNAHPMAKEFFRQATVYLWQTFGLDGFRFDSTSTIIQNNGWDFLGIIRSAVRSAAAAEGKNAPYLVGENDPGQWDMTNPAWAVMDGQWDTSEVYDLGAAAYDVWQSASDHSSVVACDMNLPQSWLRPFYESTRYGESHDTVSAQDPGNKRIAARPPNLMGLLMSKAVGAAILLSNGVPMIFMGQEYGETQSFSFDNSGEVLNPQPVDIAPGNTTDNARVLAWFRSLMGLRNDTSKGLRGDANLDYFKTGRRTVAFTCGYSGSHFAVVTFGTENQQQDSSWLGLPAGRAYKEIFNSSWPVFQVQFEQEQTNGGYTASIVSGQLLNLPYIGAVLLEAI
jgi:1,4-alpha-glucan branching enzyme